MPKVRDILKKKGNEVHTATPDATVIDTIRLMNDAKIGAVVVVSGGKVVGMFTERDVLTRVVAAGTDPREVKLSEVMTTPVAYCTADTPVEECRAIFTEKRIRHLPVMNDTTLAGLVTTGDILAFNLDSHEQTIHFLEAYIQG